MAKSAMRITLSASKDIAFDKLMLSQSNVRRIRAGVPVEELAEDIARRSLLQGLSVRAVLNDDGTETELYEIPAGCRRFQELALLVKQKRLAKTAPIPYFLREKGQCDDGRWPENNALLDLLVVDRLPRKAEAITSEGWKCIEVTRAGAFVTLDRSGQLSVYRGYVRLVDEPLAETAVKDGSETGVAQTGQGGDIELSALDHDASAHVGTIIKSGGQLLVAGVPGDVDYGPFEPLPERLVQELTAHRSLARREALGRPPDTKPSLIVTPPARSTHVLAVCSTLVFWSPCAKRKGRGLGCVADKQHSKRLSSFWKRISQPATHPGRLTCSISQPS